MPRKDQLYLLQPPYDTLRSFSDLALCDRHLAPRGSAIVWGLGSPVDPTVTDAIARRTPGVALLVMLPGADEMQRAEDVLDIMERGRPHSILPHHPHHDRAEWVELLRRTPTNLAGDFTDYLEWRGVTIHQSCKPLLRQIINLSAEVQTISRLARRVYMSRRALGRRFHVASLPPPSRWLQFARVLRACFQLQISDDTIGDVARRLGYPDGFAFSNQTHRLTGVRPSDVRKALGWEWLVERWICRELGWASREEPVQDEALAPHG